MRGASFDQIKRVVVLLVGANNPIAGCPSLASGRSPLAKATVVFPVVVVVIVVVVAGAACASAAATVLATNRRLLATGRLLHLQLKVVRGSELANRELAWRVGRRTR